MKFYVIASTEYEANMPDLFVMDEEGNYYGALTESYPAWRGFPKDVDYWRNAEGSDAGRYFNIDEVELDIAQVEKFEAATRYYEQVRKDTPVFGKKFPMRSDFETKKAFNDAANKFTSEHDQWFRENNVAWFMETASEVWKQRTELFLSFSEKVHEAISNNDHIKRP